MIEPLENTTKSEVDRLDQASQWFAQSKSEKFTSEEELSFYEWCADSENFEAYERLEDLWDGLSHHAQDEKIKLWSQASPTTKIPNKKWGMALAAVAASILCLVYFTNLQTLTTLPDDYSTKTGQQQMVNLPDNSVITLNTNTKLRITLSGKKRHIDLIEGEAFFDVAPDPERPFVVATDDITVKVLGTKFNVYKLKNGVVQVSVRQGKVQVLSHASDPSTSLLSNYLLPGDILDINSLTGELKKRTVELDHISTWKRGVLEFASVSLENVITEVNRYAQHQIQINDNDLKKISISGVFIIKDLDNFVPFIEKAFNLKARVIQGNIIELVKDNEPT